MLLAYEPRYVREARERSLKIYGAIQALKGGGIDNERIKKEISKEYGITPTYAQNYIDTVEEDERKNLLQNKIDQCVFPSNSNGGAEGFLCIRMTLFI